MSFVETKYPQYGDFDLTEQWLARKKHIFPQYEAEAIAQVNQTLACRFKIQEHFLVVVEHLMRAKLLSIDVLYTLMSLFQHSPSHHAVLFTCARMHWPRAKRP